MGISERYAEPVIEIGNTVLMYIKKAFGRARASRVGISFIQTLFTPAFGLAEIALAMQKSGGESVEIIANE